MSHKLNILTARLQAAFPKLPALASVTADPAVVRATAGAQAAVNAMGEHLAANDPARALAAIQEAMGRFDSIASHLETRLDAAMGESKAIAEPLIAKAAPRIFAIEGDLARIRREIELREIRDRDEAERFAKAGLSPDQIAAVSKPMNQAERDAFAAQIAALEAERDAIGDFLGDGPRYDPALLAGTGVVVEHLEIAEAA